MKTKFYDTCSILIKLDRAFDEFFYISDITIKELENIKTSRVKDEETKAAARALLRLLDANEGKYKICPYITDCEEIISNHRLPLTNDNQIISCYVFYISEEQRKNVSFVTNDLACKAIAKNVFLLNNVESAETDTEIYTGFKEIYENDEKLAYFYEHMDENVYDLLINQYLIVCGKPYVWNGVEHELIKYFNFDSSHFGRIKPLDAYQACAMDSIINNQVTLLGGKAGTGKSYLALGGLFYQLEKGIIDRIIVFCNPVAAKNAAKLGFYPGTRIEKLMNSQVGGVLSSKLGDVSEVERLIDDGSLVLIPAADVRGYQTPPNSGVYILEAQNLDVELIKLMLQRIDETSIVIIDGDRCTQTDLSQYSGVNNGMERVTQVFKGEDYYGQIDLQQIKRSIIAEKAEEL